MEREFASKANLVLHIFRNKKGETARHIAAILSPDTNAKKVLYILHALGAPRCTSQDYEILQNCSDGCHSSGIDNGMPPPEPKAYPVSSGRKDIISQDLGRCLTRLPSNAKETSSVLVECILKELIWHCVSSIVSSIEKRRESLSFHLPPFNQ